MTDRNLRRSAIIGLTITAILTFLTVSFGGLDLFSGHWSLVAEFSNAAGIQEASPVRVAGVRVGTVAKIERDVRADLVRIHLTMDDGVEVSEGTSASIRLRSLLGAKYVALDDPGRGRPLEDGALIPAERTTVPVDMDQFLNTLGSFAEPIDVDAVNAFVDSFATSLDGRGEDLGRLLDQVAVLADVLADRSDDLDRLIVSAERLLTAVDGQRDELGTSVENLAVVFGSLADRREDIEALVTGLDGLSQRLTPLLHDNREAIDELLGNVQVVTGVLDRQRERIDLALQQLPLLARRFTDVTNDGPWVNVYFVGTVPGPFVAHPVQVGENGGLPSVWFDSPVPVPDQEAAGTRVEWHDPEGPPPPDGYPGDDRD